MVAKHTPGPWQVYNAGAVVGTVEGRDGSIYVADVRRLAGGGGRDNARLIAAAPVMLAALREVTSAVDDGMRFADQRVLAFVRAVIARAEGGDA